MVKQKKNRVRKLMSEKNIRGVFGLKQEDCIDMGLVNVLRKAVWLNAFGIAKSEYYHKPWSLSFAWRDSTTCLAVFDKRNEAVAVRNTLIDTFQRPLDMVKADLDATWSVKVRGRDGNKCTQCGTTEDLAAHHWCRGKQRSKAARWCLDNGITLCYACHIRFAHERPDWLLYDSYRRHVVRLSPSGAKVCDNIERLSRMDATDRFTRQLWYDWGLHDPKGKYALMEKNEASEKGFG